MSLRIARLSRPAPKANAVSAALEMTNRGAQLPVVTEIDHSCRLLAPLANVRVPLRQNISGGTDLKVHTAPRSPSSMSLPARMRET